MINWSIILPTTGKSKYLLETIEALEALKINNAEVVICNDSTDDALCRNISELGKKVKNLSVRIIRTSVRGLSNARNEGVQAAIGDFILFIDDDDIWLPNRIYEIQKYFESGSNFIISAFGKIADDGSAILKNRSHPRGDIQFPSSLHFLGFPPSTWALRKDLFLQIGGFDKKFKHCEDKDFFIRAATLTTITFTPEVLIKYRVHSSSMSKDSVRKSKFNMRLMIKHRHIFQSNIYQSIPQLIYAFKCNMVAEKYRRNKIVLALILNAESQLIAKLAALILVSRAYVKFKMKSLFDSDIATQIR